MERTISLKTVKALAANPNVKLLPGDKTHRLERAILFYEIKNSDHTEEVEESKNLVIPYSSLAASKKDFVKIKFPSTELIRDRKSVV